MSTSDHEKNLYEEMKALVLRYGETNCQKVLTAIKCSSQQLVPKKRQESHVIEIQEGSMDKAFRDIMEWALLGNSDRKISLDFVEEPMVNVVPLLELYYHTLRQAADSPRESTRVESMFDALILNPSISKEMANQMLEKPKCVALFEKVILSCQGNEKLDDDVMNHIKELVVTKGVISSLIISRCNLGSNNFIRLGEMLAVNRLKSLRLESIVKDEVDKEVVAYVLASSLKLHAKSFPDVSNLSNLELGNTLSDVDVHQYRDIFNVIGTLPRLQSFSVITSGELEFLDALSDSIEFWRIRHFAVCTTEEANYQPMFEAIARSRYLQVLSFGWKPGIVPLAMCRQLFDLALSPTSGLLEIQIVGGFNLKELDLWLDDDEVDQSIATKRQLRRFDLGVHQIRCRICKTRRYSCDLTSLRALLQLLSKHLPYLHSIGCHTHSWTQQMTCLRERVPPDECQLVDHLVKQRNLNLVGMALFHPQVLLTVPDSMWPVVLNKAVNFDEDFAELRWTGIFQMVQKLATICYKGSEKGSRVKKRRIH
jgi:hypothetical protein